MVFHVPESKKSIRQNQFEFEIDGTTYSIPHLKYIDGATVEAMAELEGAGGMRAAAANYLMFGPPDSAVGKAVRTLDGEQLGELAQAWADASGIDPGKSEGS